MVGLVVLETCCDAAVECWARVRGFVCARVWVAAYEM